MQQPTRWEDEKALERVRNSPAPNSYDAPVAFDKLASPRIKQFKIDKAKKMSFVDLEIKKSVSPGPAKNASPIASLNWLSMGQTSRKRL
jgi:hypothetical protein